MVAPHALIVDDNDLNIDVLRMLLQQQGVTHSSVRLPSAVEKAITGMERIDVIFLDLEFPSGNGYDLFRILRGDPNLAGVPIIAYSVHSSDISRTRDIGFDGFLGKPLNIQNFPEQLHRILNKMPVWEG